MRKRGINLKAIENIGYGMSLAFSKAKNAEQYHGKSGNRLIFQRIKRVY